MWKQHVFVLSCYIIMGKGLLHVPTCNVSGCVQCSSVIHIQGVLTNIKNEPLKLLDVCMCVCMFI